MRSLLFVPGDSERKIAKGLASDADALILDLEDAVSPDNKSAARALCAEILASAEAKSSRKTLFVRINAFDTSHAFADLAAIVQHAPFGIMLPKCDGAADLARLSVALDTLEARDSVKAGSTRILPVATETARAVLNLIGAAPTPRLFGMLWGAEDLSADIGASAPRDPTGHYSGPSLLARNLCLFAAASLGVEPVDAVYTNFRDTTGLRAEAEIAAREGFTAKAAIHPDQVAVINDVFNPSEAECTRARDIIAAFAASPGMGAVSLDGRMLDRPHLRSAERILARAR